MLKFDSLRTSLVDRGAVAVPDAQQMLEAALKRAGRRDFSDRSFIEPLKHLLIACEAEGDLSAFGWYSVRFDVMRSLRNMLRFDAAEEANPALLCRPIERPIFITGLPRSGTTFLHELLLQDDAIAAPLSWQLVAPYPRQSGSLGVGLSKIWTEAQFRLMRLLAPTLNDLHPISADAPQECTDITAQVFQSLRFDSMYRVPSYQRWLASHGHMNAYRFHRRFLQHLGSRSPERRWILKSPDHVFALAEIQAVYPDAGLVFVHRDPVSVLASVAKLTEVLRRPFTRSIDLKEIGRQVRASWIDGSNRMVLAAAHSDSILHLHYNEVVSAPIEAAAAVFRHCGMTLSDRGRARMRTWLDRGQHRPNGRRRYSLSSFGLDADRLRAQFAPYMEAFGVQPDASPWSG